MSIAGLITEGIGPGASVTDLLLEGLSVVPVEPSYSSIITEGIGPGATITTLILDGLTRTGIVYDVELALAINGIIGAVPKLTLSVALALDNVVSIIPVSSVKLDAVTSLLIQGLLTSDAKLISSALSQLNSSAQLEAELGVSLQALAALITATNMSSRVNLTLFGEVNLLTIATILAYGAPWLSPYSTVEILGRRNSVVHSGLG